MSYLPFLQKKEPSPPPVIVVASPADRLADLIIREASRFVGLREISPNRNWDNPSTPGNDAALVAELKAMMVSTPWKVTWAYCAAFNEGVLKSALKKGGFDAALIESVARTLDASVMSSFTACEKKGLIRDTPTRGALFFWQNGTKWTGHAGIVSAWDGGSTMATIEANTSANKTGDQREGDWITTKTRNRKGEGSFKARGFLWPEDILKMA